MFSVFIIDGLIRGSKVGNLEYIKREENSYRNYWDEKHRDLEGPRAEHSTSSDSKDVSSSDFYGTPYFGQTNTAVLVQRGSHAFFHCPVHNIRNQTVYKT